MLWAPFQSIPMLAKNAFIVLKHLIDLPLAKNSMRMQRMTVKFTNKTLITRIIIKMDTSYSEYKKDNESRLRTEYYHFQRY